MISTVGVCVRFICSMEARGMRMLNIPKCGATLSQGSSAMETPDF